MANTSIQDLRTMNGRFRFVIRKLKDWLNHKKRPDQQCLTQLFKSVGNTRMREVKKWCKDFRREVQKHIGKDVGVFGELDLYKRVEFLVFSGVEIPPDLSERVKDFVIVEKKHVVEIKYKTWTCRCPYNKNLYSKHKKWIAKEKRDGAGK